MNTASRRILIVEDSRLNAQITADILKKYGYQAEIVRTGEEAVEKVKSEQNPDLILMDIELGGEIDGIETTRIIQQFTDIPVLFLTANTSKELMEKIRSVTGYGYIVKGVDEHVLISVIEMAFKLREANVLLRKDQELFRNLFETDKAIMLLVDPESGQIIEANKAACSFYGYPKETLLRMNIEAIVSSFDIAAAEKFKETLTKGCDSKVCVHRIANGEERVVEMYSSPIHHEGKILVYLIIFDITARWQTEEELKFYRYLFENSLNETYIFHPETLKFIAANRGARENLGYTQEELSKMTPLDLKPEFDLESFKELLSTLAEGKKEYIVFNTVHRRKDGSLYPVEAHLQLVEYMNRKVYIMLIIDITERKAMEEELREQNEVLATITEYAHDAIIMINDEGNITFWNPAAEKLLGYSKEEVMGKELHRLVIGDESLYKLYKEGLKKFQLSGKGSAVGKMIELKAKHKDGHEIDVELSLSAVKINSTWHAVGILRDITERKKFEELIYRQSITDPLTNIYNRRFFMQMLEREIDRTKRNGRPFSLVMFDLDHFKKINDSFGHATGDMVLKKVAETVKKRIRKTDCFARWGGEEFVIVLPETSVKDATRLAEELREQINNMVLPGVGYVTASFGVAGFRTSDTIDSILMRVDDMLYEAKAAGRNCVKSE
ncbi:PAS domain S-box-containing protein/diguanylate cyclase (GGDEF) domain-containing protein [Caldanaerobius fijiensis DSM 17918]|uniref:Stage 0 sporulation protein A homolog n=1 Tax=Caldanaerobius fijiensis DSM 17918 TaxID=1121256 RepID=A0A1M4Y4D9_9THEO|nr:PAS domain S-box protein [Caldanaerobius fijiensis]SHF00539.1 PAS domain S-box-containing protein/diguanylate cyclase (GGDEF) domain-containing protein [Caldanaerobius fijiensis DSM 17918]